MFIYVIVCNETLKIYVGQHKGANLQKYLQTKFSNAKRNSGTRSHLFAAMQKHHHESWSIHPLISGVEIRQELDELEKHFIRALNSQHPEVGYNICDGGEGFTGPHTEEWRKETLDRINEYWAKPGSRELRSQEMTERWTDSAFQQAQAEWKAANPEKMAYWIGKTRSEESKRKTSASMKGKQNTLGHTLTDEHKRKIGEASTRVQTGVPKSAEHKAKLKLAHQTCSCPHHVRQRQQTRLLEP